MANKPITKKKKTAKKKNSEFDDLVAVFFIAVVALIAYDKGQTTAEAFGAAISAMFAFVLIVLFVIAVVLIMGSKRSTREKISAEDVQNVNLRTEQALKHDLLTFFIPVLILVAPLIARQSADFIDFSQATVAFVALGYLKIMYWQRF